MTIEFGRREFLGGAAAIGLLGGCTAPGPIMPPALGGGLDLAGTLDIIANGILADFPEVATSLGVDTGARAPLAHRLFDRSLTGVAVRNAHARERLAVLRDLDLANLSVPAKLDGAVALAAHEIAVDGAAFAFGDQINLNNDFGYRNTPYVVNQMGGAFIEIPDFLDSKVTVRDADTAAAYADRVDAYARNLDGETERMAHDRALGVVAPDFVLEKAIGIVAGGAAEDPARSVILTSFQKKLAATNLDPALGDRVAASLRERVRPALMRQIEELRRHRAVSTHDAGAWHFKDGDAYYAWALRAATTTNRTPDEIHELGMEQVRAIQSRMDAIMLKQGITGGTVGERMAALGRRPDQLFPNTDVGRQQLLSYLNGQVAAIRPKLPNAFATLVPGKLEIVRVPQSIEAGSPGGYAAAGTIDGSLPGRYYINLRDTAEWPKFSLPTLTFHEGIPGHIWQGEYANRAPLIRTLLAFNAYSEGWALYAEQLADEVGMYDDDPLGQLGYLQSSSFRACRLVVDTGMHSKRWSREQAIDWFVKTNGDDPASVTGEVERYCSWPGQACGYKVGHLEILRLRDHARRALGPSYDLRTFDDALVKGGSVPMTLLGNVIDQYIFNSKNA